MRLLARLELVAYAVRLAKWEAGCKADMYRPSSLHVETMMHFYMDPVYRPDGSRRTEP